MKNNKHLIVKGYLEKHSLIESNITSFNNFIEKRIQEIVEEISETIDNEEFKITLGKIKVGRPQIIEADGSSSLILPYEARLRNFTYSAPITLEITVKKDEQVDSEVVEIGRVPIMVKSKACNTHGMTKEELIKNYSDPEDTGGYFIVNGNERVMVMAEDLAENHPFIENDSKEKLNLRVFSSKGTYRIPTTITENKEGIFELSFSRFKDIPAILILKALGLTKESDIAKYIGKETDSVIVNLYEFVNTASQEDAMMQVAENTSLQGTKKEILDRVKQRIDSYLLPHIGQKKDSRIKKAITLCKLIKQFLIVKENPKLKTDKDHYANKRVRLSGDLLANLFRVNLGILIRDILYSLQKSTKRRKFFSIKTIAKSTLFSHRVESAIATGSWTGERSGVTQNMDKTNYLATISQLQRVASMLSSDQENFQARHLHPTHYGRFCPIESPEGTEIGLRKNLAILARVSTRINLDENKFIKDLESDGLNKEETADTDVFLDGKFIGNINNPEEFVEKIIEKRREGIFPVEMNIRNNTDFKIISISTVPGRVLRPSIIVENGVSKLKNEHLIQLEQNEITWDDLIKQRVIEYLDTSEEENSLIALYPEELTQEHTHLEIDPIDLFGIITSLVPYVNHDSASKLMKGTKTLKQSLGLYVANYHCRIDTSASILEYPQKPIVRSFIYDTLNTYPAGQNLIVAIMTHEGYNMEDALVMNQGSLDRGVGRSFFFRPYSGIEMNYSGGLKDKIAIPEKDTSGYKMESSYRFLEEDGIIYPEAEISEGEVLIGKTSPPKFLSEAREISIRTKKETSVTMRQEERGTIDAVFITKDSEGNKIIQIRTRDQRIPELGDKYSNPHGQKGVIGAIIPEDDVPFTSSGIKPDIIFNPHGLPSRMTVGYLLELLSGKVGCLRGKVVDGTPFSGETKNELEKELKNLGFRFDGKETMYNGITGKKIASKIFIGNLYYLKLKRMVKGLIHGRASGKITLLTRQPVEGRARGGALRLGEMEQQALVAHGASLLLKERYDSDKVKLDICEKCGVIAIDDNIRDKIICPECNSEDTEPVEVSYAFKLLLEELQGLHIHTDFKLKNKYE
ncbi:MAG: DNA-directed RNA polymerase subunit B'' [Candidatus Pacearchaeota archaeon]|jgi:DNA-directed RNA polymerase subunit B|nr:DNA-directed RNA polymerase subunit B [Candidatus Pacearchaeota archaeon]MDP7520700.1 DNA-directed RNA polymerase subunit B'' [Candidatus Pacearchaeota archaeon]|tara:strand:+ start:837 stop:4091 length:3255 start_codon:yes stop_codon:yes gene_type:complete